MEDTGFGPLTFHTIVDLGFLILSLILSVLYPWLVRGMN
jgi:hypothetical protein